MYEPPPISRQTVSERFPARWSVVYTGIVAKKHIAERTTGAAASDLTE